MLDLRFITAVLALCLIGSGAHRLNYPRVLLPYHPTIPVSFTLEIGEPHGGCFVWTSTNKHIVDVKPIGNDECSDRAIIRANAKTADEDGELTVTIFAQDRDSGIKLNCGVSIDKISHIGFKKTTNILYVDAAPARMEVIAYNSEGSMFSTLSEIPVDWELEMANRDSRPLRIVPFEQSTYEAPPEIVTLESQKRKGYVVLVEGIATGSAQLTAKFADSYLDKVSMQSLELTVVANLLLEPSSPVYVPTHGAVNFTVKIVKQMSTEDITMPSPFYYLSMDDLSVCSLDSSTSIARALQRGRTEVHLLSQNVDMKNKAGVRPPSTIIHVVDPESLQWKVDGGNNWMLQTGTRYRLEVALLDAHGHEMHQCQNLRFESLLSDEYFDIHVQSNNQSYFEVTPKKIGKTTLSSRFVAVIDENGYEIKNTAKVSGDQNVQIVAPVKIEPKLIALPYLPRHPSSFIPTATGGSGTYKWSIEDSNVAVVNENGGAIRGVAIGVTTITVADIRNEKNKDTAKIVILDVTSLSFGETRKEALIGNVLRMNVQLFGSYEGQEVALCDCRSVPFRKTVSDQSLFTVLDVASTLPTEGTGCATISLKARASGDTSVTVAFDRYIATTEIAAYPKLEASSSDVSLALGSDFNVKLNGGPRPWPLDNSGFYRRPESVDSIVSIATSDDTTTFTCNGKEGSKLARIVVGNAPSASLPLPLHSTVTVSVCCTMPSKIVIAMEKSAALHKCPTTATVLLVNSHVDLTLIGHGVCNGKDASLDSISGLHVKWSTDNKKQLDVTAKDDQGIQKFARAQGRGVAGLTSVVAEVTSIRGVSKFSNVVKAKRDVRLVEPLSTDRDSLVLWNEASSKAAIHIKGGSGHYTAKETAIAPFTSQIAEGVVHISPRSRGSGSLRIIDSCIESSHVDVSIRVADIHSLAIRAPQFVELNSEVEVTIEAIDDTGASFSHDHGALASAVLESSNSNIEITKKDSIKYVIRGISIGTVSLTANAKSSTGKVLTARPHSMQVFSSISLIPREVTLIPESTFQLEVLGGPRPTPPIHFTLNDTKIANVEPNALITSKQLGYTSVTGTIAVAGSHVSKDTVRVKVVSLHGIRLVATTRRLERGSRVTVRLQGLAGDETPFAFGGALYPFKVTWTVSHADVLRSVHPLGDSLAEVDENKFALYLDGEAAGSATVSVRVELHANAKHHFAGSARWFEDAISLVVDDSPSLVLPTTELGVVRVAPNAQLQLKTLWPMSTVEFTTPTEYSNRVSVTKGGLLRTYGRDGPALITFRRIGADADNETIFVPVMVSAVHSIDLASSTVLESASGADFDYIPVGTQITLNVNFRDSKGRLLSAAPNKVNYRPHRFDLTEIGASASNRTLQITLKSTGETVLMVSDQEDASVFTFLRLSAADNLLASSISRPMLVNDVVCFHAPLAGVATYHSSDDNVQWIDSELGVARLVRPGTSHVTARVADQLVHAKITIGAPSELRFVDKASFVSNVEGAKYVFPVKIANSETRDDDSNGSAKPCTPSQRDALSSLHAPFECRVAFDNSTHGSALNLLSAKAVYLASIGQYACVLERFTAGTSPRSLVAEESTTVAVSAVWNSQGVASAQANVPFHHAIEVLESEIKLSDVDQLNAILSIRMPAYQSRSVTVKPCDGDIVSVSEGGKPTAPSTANKFFTVKLNVKSAALWNDVAKECVLKVQNAITEQTIDVPVQIRLVGEASKHRYGALEPSGLLHFFLLFLQHYSAYIPSAMVVVLIALALLGGYVYTNRTSTHAGRYYDDSSIHNKSQSFSRLSPHESMQSSPSFMDRSPIFKSTPIDQNPTSLYSSPMMRPNRRN